MSPAESLGTNSLIEASTTAAGTISQMARGFCSFCTKSSIELAPVAPSPESCLTLSALRSYTTQVWPFFCRRRTMLAPIRPRPIIPSCIPSAPVPQIVKRKPQPDEKLPTRFSKRLWLERSNQTSDFCRDAHVMRDGRVRPTPQNRRGPERLSRCRTYKFVPAPRDPPRHHK